MGSGPDDRIDPFEAGGAESPDGLARVDEEGVVVEANPAYAAIHGLADPGAVVGRQWTELYEGETPARGLSAAAETGSWQGELRGGLDGGTQVVEASLSRGDDATLCIVRDVSERVRRREQLEWYETVLTNTPDAIYTLDQDGRITWVNEYVLEKYDVGYDREELVGEYVSVVLEPEDINRSLSVIRELIGDEERDSGRCEVTVHTADGEAIPVELHIGLLPGPDGGVQGTIGIIREITDRKRHEQRLSVLQRVLRHNVRNASTAILGYAGKLDGIVPDEGVSALDRIREAATELEDLGDEARRIQRELDDGGPTARSVDLVEVVEGIREEGVAAHPGATVAYDLPETAMASTGDAIGMAVEALVENAVEHNDGDDPRVRVTVESARHRDDGRAAIRVADDGPGIPESERRVLTADTEGKLDHGSGLGLWLVEWFITEYDGELAFGESEWGGASVEILLPVPGE